MAKRLTYRKSENLTTVGKAPELPNQLTEEKLSKLQCHFNWDICQLVPSSLKERINTLQGRIRNNAENILPQSYCMLAYLKSMSLEDDVKQEVYGDLEKALQKLNEKFPKKETVGYYAVIIANMAYWETKYLGKHTEARSHYDEYKVIESSIESKSLKNHPEVLAMKGFALGSSLGIKQSTASVEAYKKALSEGDHVDRAAWLFGLAHAKNLMMYQSQYPYIGDLFEVETIYRQVLNLDSTDAMAMMKLARVLVKINEIQFMEEVEQWIREAENACPKNVAILEEAGNIYLMLEWHFRNNTNKLYKKQAVEFTEKAKKKFDAALKINENSRNALQGLGKCQLNIFYSKEKVQGIESKVKRRNKKENHQDKNVPESLRKAKEYFERIEDKRHYDNCFLARLLFEMSFYKEEYRKEAKDLYLSVIERTKEEGDLLRRAQPLFYYSIFLRRQDKIDEEIKYLKEIITLPIEEELVYGQEIRFIPQAQNQLLYYISQGTKHFTEQEGLAMKAFIQRKRGYIHSAIFYYKEAILKAETNDLKVDLVECLIDASETKHLDLISDLPENCLKEAKEKMNEIVDTARKFDCELRLATIDIKDKTNDKSDLEQLAKKRLDLERYSTERSKSSNSDNREKDEEKKENIKILDVLSESKRLLDRSMNLIKEKIYNRDHEEPPFPYYPCPKHFQTLGSLDSDIEEKMRLLLVVKKKFTRFNEDHPTLFKYLVDMQPDENTLKYIWLQEFIDIRNEREHYIGSEDKLMNSFPHRKNRLELARDVFDYTVDVWKKVEEEVSRHVTSEGNN